MTRLDYYMIFKKKKKKKKLALLLCNLIQFYCSYTYFVFDECNYYRVTTVKKLNVKLEAPFV